MLGQREMTMEDYVGILRRGWKIILIPALLGPMIGYGISRMLPERYTSQTLVLVEQPKVPDKYVPPVLVEDLSQTLGTMKEKILSRARLQPIIEKNNLFTDDAGRLPMEDLVAQMRKAITVNPVTTVGGNRNNGVPGFTIAFSYSDARTAQMVCSQITSMFIDEDLKRREEQYQGTTNFLETQLAEAKRKLDEEDARLADFKRRYIGQLPGKEDMNMNLLMSASARLEATSQALQRAQQDKTYAETILQQQLASLQTSTGGIASPQTLDQQLAALQSQLVALEGQYTSQHPDVVKKRGEIAQMKQRIEEQKTTAQDAPAPDPSVKTATVEPPYVQSLRTQIYNLNQTIREKTQEMTRLQQDVQRYQSRVQLSPQIEQEYKELTRDYGNAQAHYDDLLAKKTSAQMSVELNKQQQGEQFRVMDAANLPAAPSFPNRLLFAGGGLGAGIALGLGIVLLLEMKDRSMRSELDIDYFLELPTLARVPTLGPVNNGGWFWKRSPKHAGQGARA